MTSYAFLDENNIVTEVIPGKELDTEGIDWEKYYGDFRGQTCKATSYRGLFRGRFAGIGFTYNEALDVFVAPSPYPSWTLDETGNWQAPSPQPDGDGIFIWNEDSRQWQLATSLDLLGEGDTQ